MKRACVIGWPIKHSRSPLIHRYWLKRYQIDGQYDRIAVEPDQLEAFFQSLTPGGLCGCNITIPHKQTALHYVSEIDHFSRRLGAINTVFFDDGMLSGTNTDGLGFLTNLRQQCPNWSPGDGPAAILGAGGAARAIIGALLDAGVPELRITNRTHKRATSLCGEFGDRLSAHDWRLRNEMLADCALVVNTTSLGMVGQVALKLSLAKLPANAAVADIVYAPLETELLKTASERGHATADGLGMLLHQAAPGFEHWFGVKPEVTDELRQLVAADLGRC